MTGYLQRLFDRAGGDAPMPAAPSRSPVAQADQRLTVPGIGDALMWQAPAVGADAEPGVDALPPDGVTSPAAPRTLDTPRPRPGMPSLASVAPQPVAPVVSSERAQPPVPPRSPQSTAPPQVPSPIRRIGAIEADDLELPADSGMQARPPDSRRPLPGEAEPAELSPAPRAEPVVGRAGPVAEPAPSPPAPAAPAREAPVEHRTPEREPVAAGSPAAPAPEPEASRLAEPAPRAPVLAVPVPEPKPPPLEAPAPTQAVLRPPAPRPKPRRSETIPPPEAPKPPRPLTANEASLIGPLPSSRRSAILFGVRRR